MLREKPGNVVVLSGRNKGKMDRIEACVGAGLNVLADKPWLIETADFPKLEATLAAADAKGLVAYDVMTERYEITTILQKELSADREVAGTIGPGTEDAPAIEMESVHHIMKVVAGAPNLRPAWFFDTAEQGEALGDVATHLVDLVPFVLFPGQPIDYRRTSACCRRDGGRRPSPARSFCASPARRSCRPSLASRLTADKLDYYANGEVAWTVQGRPRAREGALELRGARPAGATRTPPSCAGAARASRSGRAPSEKWRPELFVVPNRAADATAVEAALRRRVAALAGERPGLAVEAAAGGFRVVVPDTYRVGHEAHFAEVTRRFLDYLKDPASLPRWERANMLAKY